MRHVALFNGRYNLWRREGLLSVVLFGLERIDKTRHGGGGGGVCVLIAFYTTMFHHHHRCRFSSFFSITAWLVR